MNDFHLKKEIDPNTVKFWSISGRWGPLCNFYQSPFVCGLNKWLTVEHFYEFHRVYDSHVRQWILEQKNPVDVLERCVASEQIPNWDKYHDAVMYQALITKFQKCRKPKQTLIYTGRRTLVYDSPDVYWGGQSGANRLGVMLSEIRELLRKNKPLELPTKYEEMLNELQSSYAI